MSAPMNYTTKHLILCWMLSAGIAVPVVTHADDGNTAGENEAAELSSNAFKLN